MAYARKRKAGGRSTHSQGRRKYARRVMTVSRPLRMNTPTMRVTRTWRWTNWTPATTNTTDFWRYLDIAAAQMPNWSEYAAVFDMFRVNNIKFTLRPRYDAFDGANTTDITLPGVTNQGKTYAHVIIDPRSPVIPTGVYTSGNLNTFLENGKVRSYSGNRPINIFIKYPCTAEDVNTSAAATYKRGGWYSTTTGGIVHRGAHVFLQDVNMTGVFGQAYDIFVTMSITLKGQR